MILLLLRHWGELVIVMDGEKGRRWKEESDGDDELSIEGWGVRDF